MIKKTLYYSLPLFGHTFKGYVCNFTQLSAKIQIWCRTLGLDDSESLAIIVAGTGEEEIYFSSEEECFDIANSAISKLPSDWKQPIDVSSVG